MLADDAYSTQVENLLDEMFPKRKESTQVVSEIEAQHFASTLLRALHCERRSGRCSKSDILGLFPLVVAVSGDKDSMSWFGHVNWDIHKRLNRRVRDLKKNKYGPFPVRPKGFHGPIKRRDGLITEVSQLHFSVFWNNRKRDDRSRQEFSRRLLPRRVAHVGDLVSVFFVKTWIHAVNINGKQVFYRDPDELWPK